MVNNKQGCKTHMERQIGVSTIYWKCGDETARTMDVFQSRIPLSEEGSLCDDCKIKLQEAGE